MKKPELIQLVFDLGEQLENVACFHGKENCSCPREQVRLLKQVRKLKEAVHGKESN